MHLAGKMAAASERKDTEMSEEEIKKAAAVLNRPSLLQMIGLKNEPVIADIKGIHPVSLFAPNTL